MLNVKRKAYVQLLVILLCAMAVKYYYSTANANDLLWILAPTTFAVEVISGEQFEFESYSGYINSDKTFLIAPACSGVNFLIAAFLLLAIGRLWRNRSKNLKWRTLLFDGVIAYLVTVIANTVRITLALRSQDTSAGTGWFDADQFHRIEGIAVYFGFLLILALTSGKWNKKDMSNSPNISDLFRDSLFPLGIYYTTTLGIPFANGAYRQGIVFWEHVAFVLITPLFLLLPLVLIRLVSNRQRSVEIK